MNPAIVWGVIFFILIGVEMFSGTFYLLMVSVGAVVGGIAALLGLDVTWQVGLAGSVAALATALLHFKRVRTPKAANYSENKDALIDIGEFVEVAHWTAHQTTQVRYRGAEWSAIWAGKGSPITGRCVIRGIIGSKLQLDAPEPQ